MKGVEPEAVDLGGNKCLEGKGVNKSGPEPGVYYPAEDIAPDDAEDYQPSPVQVEPSGIGS